MYQQSAVVLTAMSLSTLFPVELYVRCVAYPCWSVHCVGWSGAIHKSTTASDTGKRVKSRSKGEGGGGCYIVFRNLFSRYTVLLRSGKLEGLVSLLSLLAIIFTYIVITVFCLFNICA